jgi:hypothetical protein
MLTPPRSTCCFAAPSVIEFDSHGEVVQAWGGPSDPGFVESRCTPAMGCDWPETEHGIFVSDDGHVYIGGNGGPDYQVIKFTHDGTFVMQIGRAGMRGSSHPVQFAPNGTPLLGRPAEMDLDRATNELYIADGYQNTGASSSSTRPRGSTSATGAPTATCRTTSIPGRTTPTLHSISSSARLFTVWQWRAMASSTSATA